MYGKALLSLVHFRTCPWVVALLVLMAMPAQSVVPPLPPQGVSFVWTDTSRTTINLTWEAPLSGGGDVHHYNVRHAAGTDVSMVIVPISVQHRFLQVSGIGTGTHSFLVTAVDAAGRESPPGTPVVVKDGWSHCTVVSPTFNPRDPGVHPDCLMPLPVP